MGDLRHSAQVLAVPGIKYFHTPHNITSPHERKQRGLVRGSKTDRQLPSLIMFQALATVYQQSSPVVLNLNLV
jgi:hypothetical protein